MRVAARTNLVDTEYFVEEAQYFPKELGYSRRLMTKAVAFMRFKFLSAPIAEAVVIRISVIDRRKHIRSEKRAAVDAALFGRTLF